MFALPIFKPRFKRIIFFYQDRPKIKSFLQKNAKFSSAPPDPCASGRAESSFIKPYSNFTKTKLKSNKNVKINQIFSGRSKT